MQADLLLRQRHAVIQDRLQQSGRVLAADLAQEFRVSEDTIRRDLREMAAAGLCERVYGGALSLATASTSLSERVTVAPQRKVMLAKAAVGFLKTGMTVFIDAGSTNLAIAKAIPADLHLTVATNTPLIAAAVMDKPGVTLLLIGGKVDRQVGAAIGAKAQRDVEVLRPDLCVLGACGVDIDAGLTAFGFEDAEFKRFVAGRSVSVLAAVNNEKLGLVGSHAVIPIDACATLVLEHDAPAAAGDVYGLLGITLVRSEPGVA
ncbi:DeoR/GlpR family DNA-binding transcription regulator [Pararhizobium antarcticum]|uniref:DeoR family transcriptional regulator n=1 Tax=Pararhizobium antarcticum TaxID=1798805 RepID=A0A657LT68_9HYPH|nr:DeoR/GlpR family DNA-binding transcription regulator [Pararhizobium antarcticum]OJF96112.1 DeoR family transcriptional regulator [Pararhizobium antarcticum]OJG01257.1 DeoR family transcriptional regulator [Rhizobium sp. 58]